MCVVVCMKHVCVWCACNICVGSVCVVVWCGVYEVCVWCVCNYVGVGVCVLAPAMLTLSPPLSDIVPLLFWHVHFDLACVEVGAA